MSAPRLTKRTILLSLAAFASVCLAVAPLSARADESSVRSAAAKRSTTSTGAAIAPAVPNGVFAPGPSAGSVANSFVYNGGGPLPVLNLRGRLNVGKTHVYVPYYGNVSTDPNHPGFSGVAGIAYGFRGWDISVLNGGFGTTQPAAIPGADATNKANPALSLSIRF